MQKAMTERARTCDELVAVSDLGKPAVMRWLKMLREAGAVYVERWLPDRTGRMFVAAWRFGAGTDAPRPGHARTPAERAAARRAAARAGVSA
ncbi:MAG: hypothetical protein RIS35_2486 [Pseudomonadota bacterium]|jgi:DNA-binding transcriptional ArsR family regulator